VARHRTANEVSVALEEPPIRTAPLDRQVGRDLREALGCVGTEQQARYFIDPFRGDVAEESKSRRDDCSVLCPVRSLQAERILKESESRRPNTPGRPELVGHEREDCFQSPCAATVDRAVERIERAIDYPGWLPAFTCFRVE